VVGYLLAAALLGLLGGWGLSTASTQAPLSVCTVLGAFGMLWPLGWIATLRIARPLRELAAVASQLRDGELTRRDDIATADDEVGEVGEALRTMADRVADQLSAQRALLAAVSHELRSPLARLRVLIELSREGHAPEDLHDDLQGEIDGMDALVGDLLAAARIDFEALSPVPLQAHAVAARALEIVDRDATVDGPDVTLHGDATLVARALSVLLDNAYRYGGQLTRLGVEHDDDRVRFVVEDDGPGFGPGEEEHAFQPFWRRPGEARKGVGLGLALVRQIAAAHGGTAGAENRPAGGARVWLSLPR
jgi:signal transduction histidine kinase